MQNAVSTLADTVSSDALWGVFGQAIPYIRCSCSRWSTASI